MTHRNERCPCGSGRKYKKCCGSNLRSVPSIPTAAQDPRFARIVTPGWKKIRELETLWSDETLEFARIAYGELSIIHAWEDFNFDSEVPFPETEEEVSQDPDFKSLFQIWFPFNWVPDRESECLAILAHQERLLNDLGMRSRFDKNDWERLLFLSLVNAPFSFHQVVQTDYETATVLLHDLMTGNEVEVLDLKGSENFNTGMILYGRVVLFPNPDRSDSSAPFIPLLMGTGSYAIPIHYHADLLRLRKKIQGKRKKLTNKLLIDNEDLLRSTYLEIRDHLMNPAPPILTNTDGELLAPRRLSSSLSESVKDVAKKLQPLFGYPLEEMLEDAKKSTSGELLEVKFPWLKHEGRPSAQGATVLGHPNLTFSEKILDAPKVHSTPSRSSENSASDIMKFKEEQEEMLADPEVRAQLEGYRQQYWQEWLDIPLPALNGRTPRQASNELETRELLEALLLDFENKAEISAGASLMMPDVHALRKELNISEKGIKKGD
jgi:hypothetical protein